MLEKIIIRYYSDEEENDVDKEVVWARKIDEALYQIDNIPFFGRSLSLGDIVSVEMIGAELYAVELKIESGNSTVRIVFEDEDILKSIRGELKSMGCNSEYDDIHQLIAVNIPKELDYFSLIKPYLDKAEDAGILDYEESCLAHVQNGKGPY